MVNQIRVHIVEQFTTQLLANGFLVLFHLAPLIRLIGLVGLTNLVLLVF